MLLSVIIPAYNEESRLPETLIEVYNFLSRQKYSSEIVVVNDGSTDHTSETAGSFFRTIEQTSKNVTFQVLQHQQNQGKGAAMRTGIMAANGQYLLLSDADGSTPIEEVVDLLNTITMCEIAIGSRHLPESDIRVYQPWYRRLLSRVANIGIQILLLPGIADTQCGFKLFRKEIAKTIFRLSTINGWGLDMEILFIARLLGYSIKEVPITWLNSPQSRVRPIRGALRTLKELLQIRINGWKGRYKISNF